MPNLIRTFERLFLVMMAAAFLIRVVPQISEAPHLVIFAVSEIVGVILILAQRIGNWTAKPYPVTIAFAGTAAALLVVPSGTAILPIFVSTIAVVIGALIALLAKLSLGRSFGIVPANRGVKIRGLYQFVRHPMYLGYIINHIGFLILFMSVWNVAIYLAAWILLWLRTVEEEKFLSLDPAYCAYASKTRSRLIPGDYLLSRN